MTGKILLWLSVNPSAVWARPAAVKQIEKWRLTDLKLDRFLHIWLKKKYFKQVPVAPPQRCSWGFLKVLSFLLVSFTESIILWSKLIIRIMPWTLRQRTTESEHCSATVPTLVAVLVLMESHWECWKAHIPPHFLICSLIWGCCDLFYARCY